MTTSTNDDPSALDRFGHSAENRFGAEISCPAGSRQGFGLSIRSGVLREIQPPQRGKYCDPAIIKTDVPLSSMQPFQTLTNSEALKSLRTDIEKGIIQEETVDSDLAQGVER